MTDFTWPDPLCLDLQLERDDILIRDAARSFAQDHLRPSVTEDFEEGYTDAGLFREMGEHGLLGVTMPEKYGGAGASYVAYGLVAREFERIDTGYRSMMNVQSSLVMYPICRFGSPEQRGRYLPGLACGKMIGCFALTERGAGSDAASIKTTATMIHGGYRLDGQKTWISNAPIADVFIIWARSEAHGGSIRGFVVEKGARGMSTKRIPNKLAMRTSTNGEIDLDNVVVGKGAMLPTAVGLRAPMDCVSRARYEVSWGVMGAAESCYAAARQSGLDRTKFGRALAGTQLFQKKLADMATEISLGLQASLRVGRLIDGFHHTPAMTSLIKRNNVGKALGIARKAREMVGGNDMASSYEVMRHMLNLEAVSSYDGTEDVHALILGREITGHSAF